MLCHPEDNPGVAIQTDGNNGLRPVPPSSWSPSVLFAKGRVFLLPPEARAFPSVNASQFPNTPVFYPIFQDRGRRPRLGEAYFYFKNSHRRPCRMFAPKGLVPGESYVCVEWVNALLACVRRATDEEIRFACALGA